MGGECIKYTLKKSKHYYFLYMKSIHEPKQPTTFLGKSKDLEKLLSCDDIHTGPRAELRIKGLKLKPGQEAIVQYEDYSWS